MTKDMVVLVGGRGLGEVWAGWVRRLEVWWRMGLCFVCFLLYFLVCVCMLVRVRERTHVCVRVRRVYVCVCVCVCSHSVVTQHHVVCSFFRHAKLHRACMRAVRVWVAALYITSTTRAAFDLCSCERHCIVPIYLYKRIFQRIGWVWRDGRNSRHAFRTNILHAQYLQMYIKIIQSLRRNRKSSPRHVGTHRVERQKRHQLIVQSRD